MSNQGGSNYSPYQPSKALKHTLAVQLERELPIPLNPPSKTPYTKSLHEKKPAPPIEFGMKITVRINDGNECKGYMGCKVVDWHQREGEFSLWSMTTKIISQVIGVSQPKHEDMIGRLVCCEVYRWSSSFWGGLGVVEMSGDNWSKYKIKT